MQPKTGAPARPRLLIVIGADIYVRNTVRAGAFDSLDDFDLLWVASKQYVHDLQPLTEKSGWLGTLDERDGRVAQYGRIELVLRAARRRRSRTLALKTDALPARARRAAKLLSLPGLRSLARRWWLRRAGEHHDLMELLEREQPDLVLAPTGGNDSLVNDAVRCARAQGIRSLLLVHNWDGLTSKGALPVPPDYIAVWGEQSADQATSVVGVPPERVRILGAPSLDHYFRYPPKSRPSPFPFPYALFAGCYAPFDERSALESLNEVIALRELDVRIVYRPHPYRAPRAVPDRVEAGELAHVSLDPDVIEAYERSFAEPPDSRTREQFPPLESYSPLIEHAAFIVCPLSTMMLEAAIMGRPVLAIAYGDDVNRQSPALTIQFDHFRRLDRMPGLRVITRADEMAAEFERLAREHPPIVRPTPEQLRYWIFHDGRPYAERLRELVTEFTEAGVQGPLAPACA